MFGTLHDDVIRSAIDLRDPETRRINHTLAVSTRLLDSFGLDPSKPSPSVPSTSTDSFGLCPSIFRFSLREAILAKKPRPKSVSLAEYRQRRALAATSVAPVVVPAILPATVPKERTSRQKRKVRWRANASLKKAAERAARSQSLPVVKSPHAGKAARRKRNKAKKKIYGSGG